MSARHPRSADEVTRVQWPRAIRLRVAAAVFLAAILLATAIAALLSPQPAAAARLATDQIGGVALGSSDRTSSTAPDVGAAAGLLESADGRALWARKPATRRAMASITKIMVALVVLDRANLDDKVTVSKTASNVPYALGLRAGETLTVRQLLELALVASSNDAAQALAEHVGGTMPAFVREMNAYATELGLNDTRFSNPHGLDAPGHRSSAVDIASLMHTAMKDPEFRRIVALKKVTLPAYKKRKARKVESTNELLGEYRGMLGGKTGYTGDAKYGVVTTAERNGIALTAVVLGAPNNKARFTDSKRLLNWGFKHLRRQTVAVATETVGAVPLVANPSRSVQARFAETTSAVVFDIDGPLRRSLSLQQQVALPVFEGQELGRIEFTQGERFVASVPVVAAADFASAEETVGSVPVSDYVDRSVLARAADASVSVEPFDPAAPVERTVRLSREVRAPVTAGNRLGEIVYSQKGVTVARVPVVATTAVDAPGVVTRIGIWFERRWRGLTGRPTIASLELAS